MASSNVIIVPKEIGRRADGLINSGVSSSVIKGVELLLQENIYIEGGSALPAINQLDCSVLFRKGTNALQNVPFDLLGVEVNCQTVDVRKAYKKLALKYHPDKNPKTTPLFQLIQAASTKLTDSDQRAKEAATVAQKRGAAGMRAEHRASAASFQSAFQKHQSANPTSFPSAKPAAAQGSYPSQSSQAQAGGRQQPQQQPQQQQQQYAYQQYQFKQQPTQGQAQSQQQQQQSYQSQQQQQQSKPQQAAPQATPNVYGQPQPSYNAQYQQYMNQQQQRPQQPAAAQPSSSTNSSSSAQPNKAAADMKGRNYYEELLKEQYRKAAAAEERAREYANRRFAEQQQKFGAAAYNNGSAANNPFDQRAGQQQSQPNLNPFRQPANQPSNAVPMANGNPVGVPPAYEWSNINKAAAAAQPGKAAASAAASTASTAQQPNPTGGGAAGTARTYRAGADGKVHVQQSFPTSGATAATANAANGVASQQQRKMHVPKPYDFKFSSVSSTVVELEWKTTQMHHCNLAVEFSWKEKFPSFTPWETAEKLIRAGCCRKKNLKAKACYEFRVRAVEEMAGGQVGNRSDWTDVLTIVMPTVEQANPNAFPKMPAAGTNVEATPTPDVSDSYAKKSTAAAKAAAAAAAATATATPTPAQASSSANTKPTTTAASSANVPTTNQQGAASATANTAAKKPTATASSDAKNKPPVAAATAAAAAASTASNNGAPTRPRTPTQEKPSDEKVFKRFKSKSTLSKDDSGIFSPAQFQFEADTNLKQRSLDDSGPLQRKGTMQSKAAVAAASDAAHSSPIEKTLNKYFSKDKVLSASQREAWGKEQAQQQQQQQQQQQRRSRGAARNSSGGGGGGGGGGDGSRVKPSPPTQARPNPPRPDAYSDDEFDEEEVSEEDAEQEDDEEEEEEVIRVDLDKAAMRGGASVSSFDEDLLGSGSSFTHEKGSQKKTKETKQKSKSKPSKSKPSKKATASHSPEDGANSVTDEVDDGDYDDDDDGEVPDEILEESEYTDSDYSSVASHPHGAGRKKLRPKRTKQPSMASRHHRGGSGNGSGSGNGPTPVKKLDAHGNPFDFFELDASFDTLDTDEIQYYQLQPPSIGNGMSNNALTKKSLSPLGKDGTPGNTTGQVQVNYRHPVHAEPYPKSAIKGYIKPDRTIIGCALVGEWVRVKIHMAIYDTSNNNNSNDPGKKQPSKAIWGWCLRSDGSHDFLRPLQGTRSSLSSVQSNSSVNGGGGGGFSTPMTKSSAANAANAPTSSAKKMMSPPKESLQRGMTKANLGASAILNQSFFNLPKQTPTKEKMKKKSSMAAGGGSKPQYPSIDETEEVEYAGTKGKKSAANAAGAAGASSSTATAAGAGAGTATTMAGGRKPPPSNSIDENDDHHHHNNVEVWVECFDQQGHVYYYNEKTMVSKWELPEWVEEEDPTSGAKYYVHAVGYGDNITMMSTWTKPKKFARLIRSQHYT